MARTSSVTERRSFLCTAALAAGLALAGCATTRAFCAHLESEGKEEDEGEL